MLSRNLRDAFVVTARSWADGRWGLWVVIGLFVVAVAAVNPLRECPVNDDWAYAATVWRWLHTGEYRPHEWIAANPLFQTVWGGIFCRLFGESFSALRLSTIGLAVVGLIAFRGLAVEQGLGRPAANLLTLCVASSSLIFRLSLTFMTEMPFFVLMTVALLCYSRAVRRPTTLSWGLATISGGAAILARQFGMAIIPALACAWLLDPARKSRFAYYAFGLSVPVLAAGWELNQGWQHPNWAARFLVYREELFLFSQPFFIQLPWRVTVVAEYMALWLVPLVLLAAWKIAAEAFPNHRGTAGVAGPRRRGLYSAIAFSAFFAAAVVYGSKIVGWNYGAKFGGSAALMPLISQSYDGLGAFPGIVRRAATVYVVAGAGLFAQIVAARYASSSRSVLTPAELVLDFTTLFSLAFTIGFNQFVDRYFVIYIPFVAIVVAKRLEGALLIWRKTVVVCCLMLLIASAVWTRENIAEDEALWALPEHLRAKDPPERIFSDWKWLFYWQFEDYVHSGRITAATTYADLFGESWLGRNRAAADYWIVRDLNPPAGETWETVGETGYFSLSNFGWERFYAVRRVRTARRDRKGESAAVAAASGRQYTQWRYTQ